MFAGAVPRLKQEGWVIANFRPSESSDDLLSAFFGAIVSSKYHEDESRSGFEKDVADLKHYASKYLSDSADNRCLDILKGHIQTALDKHSPISHVKKFLLIIDQFEELYTHYAEYPELQKNFTDLLLKLIKVCNTTDGHAALTIVITLRADFYADASLHLQCQGESLLALCQQPVLGIEDKETLLEIIKKPAELCNVSVDSDVLDAVINELEQDRYTERLLIHLPLLQFTLDELWKKQQNRCLTANSYHALGGVHNALSRHADSVYKRLSQEEKQRLDYILLQLVSFKPDEGSAPTRRVARLADLRTENRQLIDKLASEGLLLKHENTVEVPHEALIRSWGYLQKLVNDKAKLLEWRHCNEIAVHKWNTEKQTGKNNRSLLLYGSQLEDSEHLLKIYSFELNKEEKAFIRSSITNRRVIKFAGYFIVFIIVLFAWYADKQADIALEQTVVAQKAERKAQKQRDEALKSQSLVLSGFAKERLDKYQDVFAAMRLTLEALPNSSLDNPNRPYVEKVKDILGEAINMHWNGTIPHEWYSSNHPNLTPYAGYDNGKLYTPIGWSYNTGVIFSSSGKLLITYLSQIYIWDAKSLYLKKKLDIPCNTCAIKELFISKDDELILIFTKEKLYLLDIKTGRVINTYKSQSLTATILDRTPYSIIAVDHNAYILRGTQDNKLKLILVLKGHKSSILSAAFSHDGKRVITNSDDNQLILWDLNTGTIINKFSDKKSSFLYFSRDDTNVFAVGKETKVINLLKKEEKIIKTNTSNISISPDAKYITLAKKDNTIELWDVNENNKLDEIKEKCFRGFASLYPCSIVTEFNHDGTRIAISSNDGYVWIKSLSQEGDQIMLRSLNENIKENSFVPIGGENSVLMTGLHTGLSTLFFKNIKDMRNYTMSVLPRREFTCKERRQYFLPELPRCQNQKTTPVEAKK